MMDLEALKKASEEVREKLMKEGEEFLEKAKERGWKMCFDEDGKFVGWYRPNRYPQAFYSAIELHQLIEREDQRIITSGGETVTKLVAVNSRQDS